LRQKIGESAALLSGAQGNAYEAYYVLVSDNEDPEFWDGILKGAKDAAAEQGILLEKAGEQFGPEYTKTQQMEMAIYSKPDGIILDAGDTSNMDKLIHQAAAAGIPVVTVVNDSPASERISFVSISNANLSREYGAQICKLVQEKSKEKTEGQQVKVCILLNSDSASAGQSIVLTGIQDYISSQNMADAIRLETVAVHNNSVFSAEEEIRDLFLYSDGQKPADIIVCLNLQNTTCVYQTVLDYNMVGRVEILGFYNSDIIQSALDKDIIHATIMVDTQQMGRNCVEALTEYRDSGYVSDYYAVQLSLLESNKSGGGEVLQSE
ncbi:MAG: substrate-binding domain-containing protein, partial [Lachnospiraceae bacterium]|nr:substrate-binding domain-containing protein [Lachnospiraceae bacterium]